jgi:hypothetical protein
MKSFPAVGSENAQERRSKRARSTSENGDDVLVRLLELRAAERASQGG